MKRQEYRIQRQYKKSAVKKLLAFLLSMMVCIGCLDIGGLVSQAEELQLYANSAVLIDGDTNRILYEKNANEQLPNASTTKILTCILAIESGDLKRICTVSKRAKGMPETKAGFYEEDQFYLKDLLYSLMLESHNDSAVVIAETIAGSVEEFAVMMNQKAAELGCQNFNFVTPNGLDGENEAGFHGASAYDLALIMNYCRQNETFLDITRTSTYTFSDVEGKHTYTVNNKNAFLQMEEGALTGKTGYTSKAGYCYVCAYQKDGKNYSLALLACGWPNNKTYKWKDSHALITYGNETYQMQTVGNQEDIYEVRVPAGVLCNDVTLQDCKWWEAIFRKDKNTAEEVEGIHYVSMTKVKSQAAPFQLLLGEQDQLTTEIHINPIELPVRAGENAGVLNYYIDGNYAGQQQLTYTETLIEPSFSWSISYFMKEFLRKASFY